MVRLRRGWMAGLAAVTSGCAVDNPAFQPPDRATPMTTDAPSTGSATGGDGDEEGPLGSTGGGSDAPAQESGDGPSIEECAAGPSDPVVVAWEPGPTGAVVSPDPCGNHLVIDGLLEFDGQGFVFHLAENCQPGEPVGLTFAPRGPQWATGMSTCVHIEGEFGPADQGCPLVAFTIGVPTIGPVYVAETRPGITSAPLEVEPILEDACDCLDDPPRICCTPEPGTYALRFTAPNGASVDISVGDGMKQIEASGTTYEVYDGESYITPDCDAPSHFSYYVRAVE